MNRLCIAAWISVLVFGVAGCGGGSGSGGPDSPNTGSAANGKPAGRGAVVVTVRDVLGNPVAGAAVRINTYWTDEDRGRVADAAGRAEFQEIIASKISVTVHGTNSYAEIGEQTVPDGRLLQLDITAKPVAHPAGGVTGARVTSGGVSGDGRTLDLSMRLIQVYPDERRLSWDERPAAVVILPCAPDAANDQPAFRADCVTGSDGYDAAYSGLQEGTALSVKRIEAIGPYATATPYAAVLLLDQSSSVIVDDPGDERLFAAKYFLRPANGKTGVQLGLAAFATDDPVSGQRSPLPLQPVTLFPLERPGWAAESGILDASVDSLARLEGGRKPLFAAIDRMLNFATTGGPVSKHVVVVVTDGRDDTCGTRAQCEQARDAVIGKSLASGVSIVTVGLQNASGSADHEALGLLAQGAGAAFWADDPGQLATILGELHSYFADFTDTLEATFRIEAAPGTFVPGRTVLGRVRLETCPWDCIYTYVPFAVSIPPAPGS